MEPRDVGARPVHEYTKPTFLIVAGPPELDKAKLPEYVQHYVQQQRVLGSIDPGTGKSRSLDLRPGSNYNMVPVRLSDLSESRTRYSANADTLVAGIGRVPGHSTEHCADTPGRENTTKLEHALRDRRDVVFDTADAVVPVRIFADVPFSGYIQNYDFVIAYAAANNVAANNVAESVAAYLADRECRSDVAGVGTDTPAPKDAPATVSAKEYVDAIAHIVAVCAGLCETIRGVATTTSSGDVSVLVYFADTSDRSPKWHIGGTELESLRQILLGDSTARGGNMPPKRSAKKSTKKPAARKSAKKPAARKPAAKKPAARKSAKKPAAKKSAKKPAARKPAARKSAKHHPAKK